MINQLFNDAIIYALSWTIIHSLWQVAIIAVTLKLILASTPKWKSTAKYNLGLGALMVTLLTAAITFFYYYTPSVGNEPAMAWSFTAETSVTMVEREYSLFMEVIHFLDQHLVLIGNIWLAGTVLLLIRLSIGLGYIKSLYNGAQFEDVEKYKETIQRIGKKMRLKKNIILGVSHRISTPMVIGFVKPMVLFPLGIINQLSADEVESILAHELAHIKRNDFVINLMQSIIETVFYFNPGVWYISRVIRRERENCCDDIALQNCNSYTYANVLIKLEELKQSHMPKLAMTLSRDRKSLQDRIKRILEIPSNHTHTKERIFSLLIVLAVFLAFTNAAETTPESTPETIDRLTTADLLPFSPEVRTAIADTVPSKSKSSVVVQNDDKEIEVHVEDGKIVEFKMDGKYIDPKEMQQEEDTYFYKGDKIVKIGPNGGVIMGDLDNDFQFDTDIRITMDSMLGNHFIFEKDGKGMNWKMDGFSGANEFHFDNDDNVIILNEEMDKLKEHMDRMGHEMEDVFAYEFDVDEMRERENNIFQRKKELEFRNEGDHGVHVFPRGENDFHFFHREKSSLSDRMASELNQDGLLQLKKNNKVELSGKHLKINGDKQPTNIYEKYKRIYEEYVGAALTKDSKIVLDIIGKKERKLRRF